MSRPIGSGPLPSPPVITPAGRLSLNAPLNRCAFGAPASGVSPWSAAANKIMAAPFVLEAQTTFYKGFWVMGSAGGTVNREITIWDDAYNRLITTGAVAGNNTNSLPQSAAFTATITLPPGSYYMSMAFAATTTNTNHRWSLSTIGVPVLAGSGCWTQASITLGSLPTTATPVAYNNLALPVFGLITRSVFDV